ncbi:uncharacterized protein [Lolium perenne]|uniref:uncharacterized protein n=1 Tax=Lolium perenne TaxID=4522 RepID=UPI0021F666E2|nr:dirigent protein 1-like [Lolium perenne]
MESSPQNVLPLLLISSFILAMVSPSLSCPTYCEAKIDETWYLRQVGSGPNQNQDIVVNSTAPATTSFGVIAVNNWAVLVAPDPNAVVLAHARGLHVQAGQAGTVSWYTTFSLVFEGPRFNGSTLHVTGITGFEGQWVVGGGTGELASAHGVIKHKILTGLGSAVENYRQLDIQAFYTPPTVNEKGLSIM